MKSLPFSLKEVVWSIQKYQSLPLTNVKLHSYPWPVIVTLQPIIIFTNFTTLMPSLTFTELRMVSMALLTWFASMERLPFRTTGYLPPFSDLLMLQLLRLVFSSLPCLILTFEIQYPDFVWIADGTCAENEWIFNPIFAVWWAETLHVCIPKVPTYNQRGFVTNYIPIQYPPLVEPNLSLCASKESRLTIRGYEDQNYIPIQYPPSGERNTSL